MGLLAIQGVDNPFGELISSMLFNFYPVLVLLILFLCISKGKDFGPMKKAEIRASSEGKLFADGSIQWFQKK